MSLISATRKSYLHLRNAYLSASMTLNRFLSSKQLVYDSLGDPLDVVKAVEVELPVPRSDEVLVRMLAAPVNPADINTIQGKYPVKLTMPSIPGNEGVGEVLEVGKDVSSLKPGSRVILTATVQGTWRTHGIFNQSVLRQVPPELGLAEAAMLHVNPCTAYRMLKDFKTLDSDVTVIQNGANSSCGQNIIQICKAWNVKTVNIVRNRPDIQELKNYLCDLGATYVLTEEELRTTTIFKSNEVSRPILALNCVGGKSSLEMLRHLSNGAKMVTYGGMSREPVTIPTSAFIFKNLSFHGFWMTEWNKNCIEIARKDEMFNDLIKLIHDCKLKAPVHKMIPFENYRYALKNALTIQGFNGCKFVLDFTIQD